jgi:hypothetical protein
MILELLRGYVTSIPDPPITRTIAWQIQETLQGTIASKQISHIVVQLATVISACLVYMCPAWLARALICLLLSADYLSLSSPFYTDFISLKLAHFFVLFLQKSEVSHVKLQPASFKFIF